MAYTVIPTIVTGDVATAAWGNTHLKDNFAAGVPDLFTTDGDIAIGTGADAAERVNAFDSSNLLLLARGGVEADISGIATGDLIVGQSSGVAGLETAMSQAQAEAGTDTQVRGSTAERIKQAILSLGVNASPFFPSVAGLALSGAALGATGLHIGRVMADNQTDNYGQEFELPFTPSAVELVVIPAATGNMVWTASTSFGADGEQLDANTDSTGATTSVTSGQITEIDIIAAFTGAVKGDYVGITCQRTGGDGSDTINDTVLFLGILLKA